MPGQKRAVTAPAFGKINRKIRGYGEQSRRIDQLFSASLVFMPVYDDKTLVGQCLEGEWRAFGALVDRHQQAVFNVALRMVGRYEDAQDIAQTVFMKAYQNLSGYDANFKFFSWIYRMTVNESLNFLDRRRTAEPLSDALVAKDPSPEASFVAEQLSRSIETALAGLSPENRAVIVLRHFEDMSYEDIAVTLLIPEKTVKSRLFTARRQLGLALTEQKVVFHD
jgi:RNA polymerase sigma-70 factor (ECF subfamily)